ncbi:dipeptide/oligopeptide/nickel ABC transporter ATPase [Bifidobacterium actinocoloniiforme DSM 22766]|uniref:Dipeptide/oligopeptide/nickel ABC transporter ATPase n=1 Tax=Bifidobacterium actinocoloniiforme DSM 22766 TaxID=1437605 RepID=A0A086Z1B6_9BIFI|nr:ABC transporter ATP-binding protein [Bifidobacterium actinocoloniiforme]AKV55473.1 diguanylate cyclase [Bifidobacterium actinocoloniiforme DSM 22766]KFI40316.1 dipeptide/oligopeptide/nickel ABC transporter ATPase [Bifidobacterium actinocoloniiforme DSM 22766]
MSLSIEDLTISIGGRPIVRQASLSVADGERVGLIGPSGSGKSMITKALLGILPPGAQVSGSIRLRGAELLGASDEGLAGVRGAYIGAVFQNPTASLNPVLSVAQQVALPLRLHYRLSRAERAQRVQDMLERVGLGPEIAGKYPSQLSGGQLQRVAIATALVTAPRLIVADEPTTALDAITQRAIIDLLIRLVDSSGASMLFVTHDFSVLARACRTSYVLDQGQVVEHGPTSRLLAHPQAERTRSLVRAAAQLSLDPVLGGVDGGFGAGGNSGADADMAVRFSAGRGGRP